MSDDDRPEDNAGDIADDVAAERADGVPVDAAATAASATGASAESEQKTPENVPYQAAGRSSWWGYSFFLGLVLMLSGFLWKEIEGSSVVVLVWIVAGFWFALAPFVWHAVDVLAVLRSRRGLASGFVALTIVLGTALMVGVSWVGDQHLDKSLRLIGIQPKDTTVSGRYTLSDESQKLLDDIDGTIYATYLHRADPTMLSVEVIEQLRTYASADPDFVLREITPLADPEPSNKYLASVGVTRISTAETEDVVVFSHAESGREPEPGKHKEMRLDPYAFRRTTALGEQKWLGEQMITESVYELVYRTYRIYTTTGHGESKITEEMRAFRDALQSQNIQLADKPLDLRSNAQIPEDCDLLFVAYPRTAFTAEEAQVLGAYLDGGGAMMLTVDVAEKRRTLGIEQALDKFGLFPRLNYMVLAPRVSGVTQAGTQFTLSATLSVIGPFYSDHAIVKPLRDRNFGTYFTRSTFVEIEDEPPEGLTVEPIIWAPMIPGTPDGQAVGMLQQVGRTSFTSPIPGKDRTGSRLAIAAVAERVVPTAPGEPAKSARVVYFGDTDFVTDRVASKVASNIDLAVGAVQWCIKREKLIAVSERTIDQRRVDVSEKDIKLARLWPLGVAFLSLILGGLVWWARRR